MMSIFEITDLVIMSSVSFFVACLYYHLKSYGNWSELSNYDLIYKLFKDIFFFILVYLLAFFTLCLFTYLILEIFYFP